ncbi:hypothetical protein FRX31_003062 [Thalictrum thalictroides]|uniref:MBD domain-containing protein n=1 Tax=Thalictrum thalictroides TaxID=46969 RepID=A0A7J6XCK4_THATH|nr:hypothetical protein FRX31_003062 [Thalictrum thalictroides]
MKTGGSHQQQSNQALRLSCASSTKKRRKGDFDIVNRSESNKKFECVPLNWEVRSRKRKGGKYIDKLDYFFYDPVTKKQYRSKKEVKKQLKNDIVDETETSGAVTNDDDYDDISGEDMEVVAADEEDNMGILEHAHEEMNDANPNVNALEGNHVHPPPLGIMQDLNELPPEAEWWENYEPVYPPVAVDDNLD